MERSKLTRHAALAVAAILLQSLAGCDGDDGGSSDTPLPQHTVTVSGLPSSASVTLQNNAGDDLTVSANGTTAFPTNWASSSSYAITVKSHSPAVQCAVSNASGSMASAGADPTVTCSAGTLTAVHSFDSTSGMFPEGGLTPDSAGNLYGTAREGGAPYMGTVFKLTPKNDSSGGYVETVLHSFGSGTDG